ncbi:hypothetical protein HIF97_12375 [Lactobacillus plantarum]|uniref:hypothetical protein n=1 Tax=Lactiplantibacillus plantarum TaxID=1590 RepID=UPI0015EB2DEE|nr:hypothetical protein [Lactiplantibacillus plantarum]MBA3081138.1 hypothetical protein [Lactiplantibacillus plantarum]
MAKMINTKYGYVTTQEAEMDAHLDKWMKRRAKQHGAFSLENKTKPVYQVSQDDGFNSEKKGN